MTQPHYEPIALNAESTVVAEFVPDASNATAYQSEAALEQEFVCVLETAFAHRLLRV